jgi:phage shock protein C
MIMIEQPQDESSSNSKKPTSTEDWIDIIDPSINSSLHSVGSGRASKQELQTKQNWLNRLSRSNTDVWLGGVCGGLGEHTPIPSWCWRGLFLGFTLAFGVALIPYLVLWICMPRAKAPTGLNKSDDHGNALGITVGKPSRTNQITHVSIAMVTIVGILAIGGITNFWSWMLISLLTPMLLLPIFHTWLYGHRIAKVLKLRVQHLENDLDRAKHRISELESELDASAQFFKKLQDPSVETPPGEQK